MQARAGVFFPFPRVLCPHGVSEYYDMIDIYTIITFVKCHNALWMYYAVIRCFPMRNVGPSRVTFILNIYKLVKVYYYTVVTCHKVIFVYY